MPTSLVVINRQRRRRIQVRRLRDLVSRAGRALRAHGELALLLAGDGTIRRLNQRYRGKDKPTDVLSFPGGDGGLGDVVISVPAAERNARRLERSFADEMDVLVLHGFLHALGYDHETDDGTMDRLEKRLRRRLLGHA